MIFNFRFILCIIFRKILRVEDFVNLPRDLDDFFVLLLCLSLFIGGATVVIPGRHVSGYFIGVSLHVFFRTASH